MPYLNLFSPKLHFFIMRPSKPYFRYPVSFLTPKLLLVVQRPSKLYFYRVQDNKVQFDGQKSRRTTNVGFRLGAGQ